MSQELEPPGAIEPPGGGRDLTASGVEADSQPVLPEGAARVRRGAAISGPNTSTPPSEGGPPAAKPDRKALARRPGVWAPLVALLLLIVAVSLTSRCERELALEDRAPASTPESFTTPVLPETTRQTRLLGKVVRELPLDEGEGEDQSPRAQPLPGPASDPELERMLAQLPPWKLEAPLPGSCRVRAWQGSELAGSEVGCEADGSYVLELRPGASGLVHVELLIEGHLRGLLDVEVDPGDPAVDLATVALGPGHRVAGQTVDARGEPLAGVHVQALPRPNLGEAVPWRVESDAEGRFEFTTLPFGPTSLRGIKPGYALSVVEALAPEDAVLMILDALINLEGEVVGDPALLARASVRLEGSSVWPAIERELEADGRFEFESLPDGVYGVEVVVLAEQPGAQEYASVPLENVTPDLHVAVALVPAFRVPVRVVDPEGAPVPGARVTLGYSQIGMLQKVAETDEQGRAQVGPVVPGPYFVHADADGFLPPGPVEVEVRGDGEAGKEQVLVLIRPATLEGVVVDENDRPVAGAEVWLDSEVAFSVGEAASRRELFAVAIGASEGSLGVTRGAVPDIPLFADEAAERTIGAVRTDEQGRFELALLLPGSHRIWATHGQHAASAVQRYELRSGELRGGLRLQLREGVALTGVVRSANGQAIANVQIDLGDGLVLTTDERGVFDAGFRRGQQELVLRGPGLIPKRVEVDLRKARASGVDIEVELEPALARLEGRVLDGNNQPIADVEVELRPLDGLSVPQITWTDARGLYQFEQLTPGPVELSFAHGEYVASETKLSADEAGGLGHELVLQTGWGAEVLVRSAGRGDPIAGAKLRAGPVTASSDGQGVARLDRLIGAKLELEVSGPGWVSQRLMIHDEGRGSASEGGRVSVIVELVESGSIAGTIDDDIGEPVRNATIEILSRAGAKLGEGRSDGAGAWQVDGIPAGDVEVRAKPPGAMSAVLAPVSVDSDVLRGELTRGVRLRFDRL